MGSESNDGSSSDLFVSAVGPDFSDFYFFVSCAAADRYCQMDYKKNLKKFVV